MHVESVAARGAATPGNSDQNILNIDGFCYCTAVNLPASQSNNIRISTRARSRRPSYGHSCTAKRCRVERASRFEGANGSFTLCQHLGFCISSNKRLDVASGVHTVKGSGEREGLQPLHALYLFSFRLASTHVGGRQHERLQPVTKRSERCALAHCQSHIEGVERMNAPPETSTFLQPITPS